VIENDVLHVARCGQAHGLSKFELIHFTRPVPSPRHSSHILERRIDVDQSFDMLTRAKSVLANTYFLA
jgi:hypothetical protein